MKKVLLALSFILPLSAQAMDTKKVLIGKVKQFTTCKNGSAIFTAFFKRVPSMWKKGIDPEVYIKRVVQDNDIDILLNHLNKNQLNELLSQLIDFVKNIPGLWKQDVDPTEYIECLIQDECIDSILNHLDQNQLNELLHRSTYSKSSITNTILTKRKSFKRSLIKDLEDQQKGDKALVKYPIVLTDATEKDAMPVINVMEIAKMVREHFRLKNKHVGQEQMRKIIQAVVAALQQWHAGQKSMSFLPRLESSVSIPTNKFDSFYQVAQPALEKKKEVESSALQDYERFFQSMHPEIPQQLPGESFFDFVARFNKEEQEKELAAFNANPVFYSSPELKPQPQPVVQPEPQPQPVPAPETTTFFGRNKRSLFAAGVLTALGGTWFAGYKYLGLQLKQINALEDIKKDVLNTKQITLDVAHFTRLNKANQTALQEKINVFNAVLKRNNQRVPFKRPHTVVTNRSALKHARTQLISVIGACIKQIEDKPVRTGLSAAADKIGALCIRVKDYVANKWAALKNKQAA